MASFRTFIAVALSAQARARAAELAATLQASGAKASWTRPENLHLTLKFLGDTDQRRVADVARGVQQAAGSCPAFWLRLRGAGAFPGTSRPRTLWIGADEGRQEMGRLATALEHALHQLGFARERRPFQPHLTLGRVRQAGPQLPALSRLLQEQADFDAGRTLVDELLVMASFLHPSGATYQRLASAPLADRPAADAGATNSS